MPMAQNYNMRDDPKLRFMNMIEFMPCARCIYVLCTVIHFDMNY
jgi:hypothetical protein